MKAITHRLLTACAVVISISALAQGTTRYTPDGDAYNYDDGYVLVDSSGNAGGYTRYWGYDNPSQTNNIFITLHRRLSPTELLIDVYSFLGAPGLIPPPPYMGLKSVPGPTIIASPFSSTIVASLGIVAAGNTNILFWPTNTTGTNCVLQSTANLASPNWLPATDTLAVAYGSQVAVSVTCSSAARFFRLSVVPPTTNGMVLIPAGGFTMGNCMETNEGASTELPLHTVYVSAFYMDSNLVSYTLWTNVFQWATNHGYSFDNAGSGKAGNHPVQTVNWYDVVKWCNARSEKEGRVPCYYTNASQSQATIYRNGQFDLATDSVSWVVSGYRLPTEAEWEKAARGGASGNRFPRGDTISESQANYYSTGTSSYPYDLSNTGYNPTFNDGVWPYTSPVGYFAANGYGLYDMAGNVWEWCWDWFSDTYYSSSPGTDPCGPASTPYIGRLLRGGSWYFVADQLRCSRRYKYVPASVGDYPDFGFRCVRGL